MELGRVTEAAALLMGWFMGRGRMEAADRVAVDAMRLVFKSIEIDAVVVKFKASCMPVIKKCALLLKRWDMILLRSS